MIARLDPHCSDRHQPFLDLRRALMDVDHVRYPLASVFASRTWTAFGMAKTQPANDLRAQLATRYSVDGRVDGFVGNLQ